MLQNSDGSWSEEQEKVLMSQYPLHHACRDSNTEALKQVLLCLQQNISNSNLLLAEDSEYGWTAAHFAAYFGSLQCLRLLQEAGKVLNSSRQSAGLQALQCPLQAVTSRWRQTLLHVAAFAARAQCAQWLVHAGALVDVKDSNGETALHKACRSGAWDCIQLLLEMKADASIRNTKGLNPAEVAVSCNHPHIAQQLLQHVAATTPSTMPALSHMVSSNGYYGYSATTPHDGGAAEVDMEADTPARNGGHAGSEAVGVLPRGEDPLMNAGVALDAIPVAGRKRGREDEECQQSKRSRYQDGVCHALHDLYGEVFHTSKAFAPNPHHDNASVVPGYCDEGVASLEVWRSRGDRMSGNSTDSQDSGFCGSHSDNVASTRLAAGSTISSSHGGSSLYNGSSFHNRSNPNNGSSPFSVSSPYNASNSYNSSSLHNGSNPCNSSSYSGSSPYNLGCGGSSNPQVPVASVGAPDGDPGPLVGSISSGCSGCLIPAPTHLLACDAGSGGRNRKLFGGHMF